MKKYNLAVIGCGNMAQAIIRAVTSSATQEKLKDCGAVLNITVSDIDGEKLKACPKTVETTTSNETAVKNADFVLLAVKPQSAPEMLKMLSLNNKVIISIMAGTNIQTLKSIAHSNKVVRVMPNLNARIGKSYNAYSCEGINAEEKEFVSLLLSSFGIAEEVTESKLDEVTGLTGSSPAFVLMFVKSFIEEGVKLGFSRETACNMALTAVIGSAELVKSESATDLDTLISSVCSKGGTTIEGVNYLKSKDFENTVQTAIEKSVERAKELSGVK